MIAIRYPVASPTLVLLPNSKDSLIAFTLVLRALKDSQSGDNTLYWATDPCLVV